MPLSARIQDEDLTVKQVVEHFICFVIVVEYFQLFLNLTADFSFLCSFSDCCCPSA